MCDGKYMFGFHLVQARMVKTCQKKVNRIFFFVQSINQSIFMLELKTVFAWLSQNFFNNL